MKNRILSSLVLVVFLAGFGVETLAAPPPASRPRPGPHPTRLIAKLKPEPGTPMRVAAFIAKQGLSVRKQFKHQPGVVVLDELAGQARPLTNVAPQERKIIHSR